MKKMEKYFIKIDPKKILAKLVEEKVQNAYLNLECVEKLIKEKLRDKADGLNLPLLIGNSTKSTEELIDFIKI